MNEFVNTMAQASKNGEQRELSLIRTYVLDKNYKYLRILLHQKWVEATLIYNSLFSFITANKKALFIQSI